MCGIILDTIILSAVLSAVEGEEVNFVSAFVIALITSIATGLIAFGLVLVIGIAGVFVATLIGAVGVGIGVSAVFGIEIKKAILIGGLFAVARIIVYFLLAMIFSSSGAA